MFHNMSTWTQKPIVQTSIRMKQAGASDLWERQVQMHKISTNLKWQTSITVIEETFMMYNNILLLVLANIITDNTLFWVTRGIDSSENTSKNS